MMRDALLKIDARIDSLLLILWYLGENPNSVSKIKEVGLKNGMPEIAKWNISDILRKNKSHAINLKGGWQITSKGIKRLKRLGFKKPSMIDRRIVSTLDKLKDEVDSLPNKEAKKFILEALKAFELNLFRSAVVLSWCGAISLLHHHVFDNYLALFNSEAKKRNSRWQNAKHVDDFGRIKESDFLDILAKPPLSIINKNLKEDLKNNCLSLRNACGHPNSYKIGQNKVAAHLEILTLNIFGKFS